MIAARFVFVTLGLILSISTVVEGASRPNIVWIFVDDMSANFSCYGEKTIETPHVDRMAREGTRFTQTFVTAPVCSPCRSALITGMYQTSIGAHQHRSGRGVEKIHLPTGVQPIPTLFQQAGYFTCIGDGLLKSGAKKKKQFGKTDYNFEWDPTIYDSDDWADRKPDQPFFMQVELPGGKLRGNTLETCRKLVARAKQKFGSTVKPEDVTLAPYYPRDPVLLEDWAAYLDTVRMTDDHVGQVMARLEAEKLLDSTIVVFMTDHGISHARGKQFLYDEGTHVPFVVQGPGIEAGKTRDDLVEHIDLAATSLAWAGIAIPESMQGRDLFAENYQPREEVFAARDRCDETVEQIRSVRTGQYLYIRNYHPQRPMLQPNVYKDGKSIVIRLRELHEKHQLDPLTESLLFSPTRPAEELYDWKSDRHQIHNLADDAAHRDVLEKLRGRLDRWVVETHDHGAESEAMYDSDMAVYLGDRGNRRSDQTLENIALMKRWAKEGK
ncbi:MAG: sulfatase [Planctomycetaceae bacterium]|nr:sulfatase [Planctomycetaceae bacterium]